MAANFDASREIEVKTAIQKKIKFPIKNFLRKPQICSGFHSKELKELGD